jgi:hypothetical protein
MLLWRKVSSRWGIRYSVKLVITSFVITRVTCTCIVFPRPLTKSKDVVYDSGAHWLCKDVLHHFTGQAYLADRYIVLHLNHTPRNACFC